MKELQTIEEHILIRNTIGYDVIKYIDVLDIPNVISFLIIIDNYLKMQHIDS